MNKNILNMRKATVFVGFCELVNYVFNNNLLWFSHWVEFLVAWKGLFGLQLTATPAVLS